jgi:hypothetical protein
VSPRRAFLVVSAVLALSGCGSSEGSEPAERQQSATAPPIEAIDEPAEVHDFTALLNDADVTSVYWCLDQEQTDARVDCPTPEGAEKLQRQQEEFIRAIQPAKGVKPRAIARLRLSARGPKSYARLVAWQNPSDKLCIQTEIADQGSSPDGPCIPHMPCEELCLDLHTSGSGEGNETLYLLGGVVDSKADQLRLTLEDGRIDAYGLTGPLVPGFPEYRVFMLDMGRHLYQRLELRLGDKVLAEETLSPGEIRLLRCMEGFPPALPSQDRTTPRGEECLPRAVPK